MASQSAQSSASSSFDCLIDDGNTSSIYPQGLVEERLKKSQILMQVQIIFQNPKVCQVKTFVSLSIVKQMDWKYMMLFMII